ncbi:MAG: type III-B CRISPR module RAMP protein Cmr4 [Acidobacteriota bacterium]
MKMMPFLLHVLSPLHAGTGQAADVIDLPIARMKATGIPFVPGTSIKGVLRDACGRIDIEKTEAIFGTADAEAAHAGALVVGDARLLALPVRSFKGTFAWTSSPLLLVLAQRDLATALPIPSFQSRGAKVAPGPACIHNGRLYLEDLDLPAEESAELAQWAEMLAPVVSPGEDIFTKRFSIVDDDTMAFLSETATQVDARVRLSERTRTVERGALWLEESLPPETLLIGLLAAESSRAQKVKMDPDEVLEFALTGNEAVQLGGKATTGHGRCRLIPVPQAGAADVRR